MQRWSHISLRVLKLWNDPKKGSTNYSDSAENLYNYQRLESISVKCGDQPKINYSQNVLIAIFDILVWFGHVAVWLVNTNRPHTPSNGAAVKYVRTTSVPALLTLSLGSYFLMPSNWYVRPQSTAFLCQAVTDERHSFFLSFSVPKKGEVEVKWCLPKSKWVWLWSWKFNFCSWSYIKLINFLKKCWWIID